MQFGASGGSETEANIDKAGRASSRLGSRSLVSCKCLAADEDAKTWRLTCANLKQVLEVFAEVFFTVAEDETGVVIIFLLFHIQSLNFRSYHAWGSTIPEATSLYQSNLLPIQLWYLHRKESYAHNQTRLLPMP